MEEEILKSIPEVWFKPAALILFMAGLFLLGVIIYLIKTFIVFLKEDMNKKDDRIDENEKLCQHLGKLAIAHEERFKHHEWRLDNLDESMKESRIVKYDDPTKKKR